MSWNIRRAAVLGSGVMGSGIAAHLANAGLEVLLLDRIPPVLSAEEQASGLTESDPRFRNRLALAAIAGLSRQKPSPVYTREVAERIRAGNFEDDLERIREADWVIEVVVEDLAVKRELLDKVERCRRAGTIVSSNTSGISIERMAEGRPDEFRRHFLVTHFFNPPRYMKLLEIVPNAGTDPALVEYMREFCRKKLGKGVVVAKDTPNFIANRIGTYGLLVTLAEMQKQGLTVSDVDTLTGPIVGRPKSATFRTLDLVGLDTFAHVVRNVHDQADDPAEKQAFALPPLLAEMIARGATGEKAGRGFYRAEAKEADGEKEILQLDPQTLKYVPKNKTRFASYDRAKNGKTLPDRLKAIVTSDDAGGTFVWNVLKKTLLYTAAKIPEIADEITAVDDAMKWGFGWELGPFETWDAIGVPESVARMEREGELIPSWVKAMLEGGRGSFYEQRAGKRFYVRTNGMLAEHAEPREKISLAALKEQNRIVKKNAGATLIDLGDDVACLEFHSVNNTIGPDVLQMIHASLAEVRQNYRGLVIGHQGKNFCVGANLMMLLMEAQDENWPEIERMVTELQQASMAIKYFEKPVVAAPFAMTLGGGVEVCLPSAQVQASAETYMGLVEVGVGLIPAGGGTKELLCRFTVPVDFDGNIDLQPFVNRAFETIGLAKVSTSAHEAKELGYLRAADRVSLNADYLLHDAKQAVLGLSIAGYEPPQPRKVRVVGEPGLAVLNMAIYQLQCSGRASEHDALIGRKLAHVLCGGRIPAKSLVSEQYLLDLEKEAFLSLCGEPKSQARMQHMLLARKPLRN